MTSPSVERLRERLRTAGEPRVVRYPHYDRPMPRRRDRIRLDYGPGNANTWHLAGEVRAVVDGQVIVVLRWFPHRRCHRYAIVDRYDWSSGRYVHLPQRGQPIPETTRCPECWGTDFPDVPVVVALPPDACPGTGEVRVGFLCRYCIAQRGLVQVTGGSAP